MRARLLRRGWADLDRLNHYRTASPSSPASPSLPRGNELPPTWTWKRSSRGWWLRMCTVAPGTSPNSCQCRSLSGLSSGASRMSKDGDVP